MHSASSDSRISHSIASIAVRRGRLAAAALACALALSSCVTGPAPPAPSGEVRFVRAAWSDLPGWREDDIESGWPAWRAGCRALMRGARTRVTWLATCSTAMSIENPDAATARRYFEDHFSPYRIVGADGTATGLVTGYYEPLLAGSRERTTRFDVPIYARPEDLLIVELASLYPDLAGKRVRARLDGDRVVPYWTRAEIESGAPMRARVLAWLDDPIDAFFLQIQGSGRVMLGDGTTMRIGYSDQNGHPYKAIGRVLVERGELAVQDVSMQSIRAWGESHRERLAALLDENASYVFFREVPPPEPGTLDARIDGPYGSLGVPLLAQRTIAVDPSAIPLGAPVFIATSRPRSDSPLARLTFAQDTGGAIRGAVRADFFFGAGDRAADDAGRMRERGSLWLVWPNDQPLPVRENR